MGTEHTDELHAAYRAILDAAGLQARTVEVAGRRVHVTETGEGPPLVLVHGSGSPSLFFRPLLERLEGMRAIAPDRPGQGLSDPADLPLAGYREAVVAWVDGLLDALGLDTAPLLGHSMGGLWSLWYALARPERVERLVLLAPPQLPGTRVPLPYRVMATPGLGALVRRLSPPSPKALLQFARFMGEADTLPQHPDLVDLLVAAGRDPVGARAQEHEVRAIVSPAALLGPTGFRRRMRVQPDELRRLGTPTLLVWGEHEPLGGPQVAREVADLLPEAEVTVLPAGHGCWLGHPDATARGVADFLGVGQPRG